MYTASPVFLLKKPNQRGFQGALKMLTRFSFPGVQPETSTTASRHISVVWPSITGYPALVRARTFTSPFSNPSSVMA